MKQSTSPESPGARGDRPGLHVALILDGNGRWAESRGLSRCDGHRAGVEAVRGVVEAAPAIGIGTLTLYAFSADNWRRPVEEVSSLLGLLRRYLDRETAECARRGIRLEFLGRRDRLPRSLAAAMAAAERRTAAASRLLLRIAVDYSSRQTILGAASLPAEPGSAGIDEFQRRLARAAGCSAPAPAVDLLIRTGGERRLSDFLLFECAYAELVFLDLPWPEFTARHLAACVEEFHGRERRFGGLPARAASA